MGLKVDWGGKTRGSLQGFDCEEFFMETTHELLLGKHKPDRVLTPIHTLNSEHKQSPRNHFYWIAA